MAMQPFCQITLTSCCWYYDGHANNAAVHQLDLGAEATKAEPKNIPAEASRISVEPKLQNVWASQSKQRNFAADFFWRTVHFNAKWIRWQLTFRMSRRRRKVYIGHMHLSVFVCPRPHAHTTARTQVQPGGMVEGAP